MCCCTWFVFFKQKTANEMRISDGSSDVCSSDLLIADYERWHRPGEAPVEVVRSIHEAGIANMEIYRAGNRLFMIIDAEDHYSDEAKARADAANPHVQKWIALMQRFQQPIPAAGPDGTWMAMDCIYRLTDHLDFHAIAR